MTQLKGFLVRLSILTSTFIAALLVLELVVRVISARKHIYVIEMMKYAQALKQPDPLGQNSHVHRNMKTASLMGVDIALNSMGHRNPELPTQRQKEDKVIYVLGSSVTMGWGVSESEVFTARVAEALNEHPGFSPNRFHLVNAGIGNYNSRSQLHLYEQQFEKIRPDMVVLHYFINDVEAQTGKTNHPIYQHSYLATYVYQWAQGLTFFAKETNLADYYTQLYASGSREWQQTLNHIEKIASHTQARNIPFLVMIVPDFHNLESDSPYKPLYLKMEKQFKAKGFPTLNLLGAFEQRFGKNEAEVWIQPDDPHPNAKGHALMAEILYQYMVEANPLQLRPGAGS